jgi:predicted GH43/DUF377 family glycosyl hydrolase
MPYYKLINADLVAARVDSLDYYGAIYYGGVDAATALAFTRLDKVLDFIKTNSEI